MKKFLLAICFCLITVTSSFAASLDNNYPQQAQGILACTLNDTGILGLTGFFNSNANENTEMERVFNDFKSFFSNKFSLNIDNDLEHIGLFVFPDMASGQMGVKPIGFASGHFNEKNIIASLKSTLASQNLESNVESISINGSNKTVLVASMTRTVFYSESLILIGDESIKDFLKNNNLVLGKAPQGVTDLIKDSRNFIYIGKNVVSLLAMQAPVPVFAGMESLAVYLSNEGFTITALYENGEQAKQLKEFIESAINAYGEQYKADFEKAKQDLKSAKVSELHTKIAGMYGSAKTKDFIDSIKINVNSKITNICIPNDDEVLFNGIASVVNIAANFFFKLGGSLLANTESAKEKACFSNIRVLQGATEMYNMDQSEMMTELNIEALIKEKYLKGSMECPNGGEYKSKNDLSSDGYIYCTKHGDINSTTIFNDEIEKERKLENERAEFEKYKEKSACFSNQRVLQGATEMYNMDNVKMLSEVNIDALVKAKYLKVPVTCLSGGEYLNEGSLIEDGFIYCTKHGDCLGRKKP